MLGIGAAIGLRRHKDSMWIGHCGRRNVADGVGRISTERPSECMWAEMVQEPAAPSQRAFASAARAYVWAALMVAASTLLGLGVAPQWGTAAVDLLYLPAVLGTAIIGGLRPALFSALAATLCYNYFFTTPQHTFRVDSPPDVVTLVVLFLVAVVVSQLAASVRQQAQIAAAHASRQATIAGLARRLLSCRTEAEIAVVACDQLRGLFHCKAMLVKQASGPVVVGSAPAPTTLSASDAAEASIALRGGEPAGPANSRANTAGWQFHPVKSQAQIVAAIGLAGDEGAPPLDPLLLPLLENLLDQIALALDRARVEAETREFAATRARDKARSTLLSSIEQDLSPPIRQIMHSVTQLRRSGSIEREVVSGLTSEASKLERYVASLTDLGVSDDRQPIEAGGVIIDLFHRTVSRDGNHVHLPPKEYALLAELSKHPGRVLTHGHLLRTVWGPAHSHQMDYLRVAIRGLRQKLERDPARPSLIVNEPAVGYRLAVA